MAWKSRKKGGEGPKEKRIHSQSLEIVALCVRWTLTSRRRVRTEGRGLKGRVLHVS